LSIVNRIDCIECHEITASGYLLPARLASGKRLPVVLPQNEPIFAMRSCINRSALLDGGIDDTGGRLRQKSFLILRTRTHPQRKK